MSVIDIKVIQRDDYIDIDFDAQGRIRTTESLETPVLVSLLTDRRANVEEVQLPQNRRGWWADFLSTTAGHQIGSKWWLLEQARLTQDTVNKARDFTERALQWMIESDLVDNIEVQTSRENRKLIIFIRLIQKGGVSEIRFFDALNSIDFEFTGI